MSGPAIFLSHSSEDEELAQLLVELLESGTDLDRDQLVCTSVAGYRIPNGQEPIEYLRTQLSSAGLIVFLVSPAFLRSRFCSYETGAAWVLDTSQSDASRDARVFFLLAGDTTFDDLPDVMRRQAARIDDRAALQELFARIGRMGSTVHDEWQLEKSIDRFAGELGTVDTHGPGFTIACETVEWSYRFDRAAGLHEVDVLKLTTFDMIRDGEVRLPSVVNSMGEIESLTIDTNRTSGQTTLLTSSTGRTEDTQLNVRRGQQHLRLIRSRRRVPLGQPRTAPAGDPIFDALYSRCLLTDRHQCSGTRVPAPAGPVRLTCSFDDWSYPETVQTVVLGPNGSPRGADCISVALPSQHLHIVTTSNLPRGAAFYAYWRWPDSLT